MPIAILFLSALAATPAPVCQNKTPAPAVRAAPVRVHPLTAEPPARQILTVLRTVDGCTRPVVVREDVGARRR